MILFVTHITHIFNRYARTLTFPNLFTVFERKRKHEKQKSYLCLSCFLYLLNLGTSNKLARLMLMKCITKGHCFKL